MLTRQKILLRMLERACRPVSRLEITKWCFLLSRETPSGGCASFYQFLPYHYGPFSFCLYREADNLTREGALKDSGGKHWELGENLPGDVFALPSQTKGDIDRILARCSQNSSHNLLDYVYRNYPEFTVNSRREGRLPRRLAQPSVYTAGYASLQIDGFLNMLVQSGISRVIDVRHHPVARRYGFHKATLERLCKRLDIDYVHAPQLGIPSTLRRSLKTLDDYKTLFAQYEEEILQAESRSVEALATLVSQRPSALVCAEADPRFCHRSRLAAAISRITGLPVRHMEASEWKNGSCAPRF
ncbi:MAG TPA: DUF488 domain-containing protein [Sumerlaeia bacterium]|nr:DUF488 domain-containing protein [Sumerlaeia bacterium]